MYPLLPSRFLQLPLFGYLLKIMEEMKRALQNRGETLQASRIQRMGESEVCVVLLRCRNSPATHRRTLDAAGLGPELGGTNQKLCVLKNVIDFKLHFL